MASGIRQPCGSHLGCKKPRCYQLRGLLKRFCIKHFNEHRQTLNKELDDVFDEYDELQNLFMQKADTVPSHITIQRVNQ